MKKIILSIALACLTAGTFSQTNTPWSTTGNIGIGTTNPGSALSVSGTLTVATGNASGDVNNLLLSNPNASTTTNDTRGTIWVDNDGKFKFRSVTGYGVAFVNTANNADILRITDAGLFVGTSSIPSGYAFAVNGSGLATAFYIKAAGTWGDFVFKPDYRLRPLDELNKYINLYHHLPDMPAAAEVTANGINLGETDRLLTIKVEELSLYLIEKDKQLAALQQQVTNLTKQMRRMHTSRRQHLRYKK